MTDEEDRVDERVLRRLDDLARIARDASFTVGLGVGAYLEDSANGRVLRNNGRHILVQVATVVEKLPDGFKESYPEIDWVAINRMRNLIAHHYDLVDDRLVFNALANRIPDLIFKLGLDASR